MEFLLHTWFWNPDQTVWSNQENLKLLLFAVLLVSRTVQWEKSKDPCEPWSDLMILRTVIRPLLTVPYLPLNLILKKKKKKYRKTDPHRPNHTELWADWTRWCQRTEHDDLSDAGAMTQSELIFKTDLYIE